MYANSAHKCKLNFFNVKQTKRDRHQKCRNRAKTQKAKRDRVINETGITEATKERGRNNVRNNVTGNDLLL